MCHTELALKKKCNSLGWRHVKSFQIYLQDSLALICSHQCQAASRPPWWLGCCDLEGLWWPPILNFWWKVVFPVLVAPKHFSQIQTKTIISPDFRPLQRTWWCHKLSRCFLWQWMERNGHCFSDLQENSCLRRRRISPYLCPFLSPDYEGMLDELGLTS